MTGGLTTIHITHLHHPRPWRPPLPHVRRCHDRRPPRRMDRALDKLAALHPAAVVTGHKDLPRGRPVPVRT